MRSLGSRFKGLGVDVADESPGSKFSSGYARGEELSEKHLRIPLNYEPPMKEERTLKIAVENAFLLQFHEDPPERSRPTRRSRPEGHNRI